MPVMTVAESEAESVTWNGHHLTVGFGAEAIVGDVINVFRNKSHSTITQKKLSAACVT